MDAANYVSYARAMWTSLAARHRVGLLFVEVVCTDLAAHAERLASRPLVPGLPRLTMDDVVVRYAETEAWGAELLWLVNNTGEVDHDRVFADVLAALERLEDLRLKLFDRQPAAAGSSLAVKRATRAPGRSAIGPRNRPSSAAPPVVGGIAAGQQSAGDRLGEDRLAFGLAVPVRAEAAGQHPQPVRPRLTSPNESVTQPLVPARSPADNPASTRSRSPVAISVSTLSTPCTCHSASRFAVDPPPTRIRSARQPGHRVGGVGPQGQHHGPHPQRPVRGQELADVGGVVGAAVGTKQTIGARRP